jgi:outer membrane protein assembly factor BamB
MTVKHPFQQRLIILVLLVQASWAQAPWPQFRGPWGNGLASVPGAEPQGLPIHWSEKENIRWKTPIPYRGWSTPAVMDGQVWLTTATLDGHDFFVVCVDADSGRIRFQEKLFHADHPEPLGNPLNCYASPSPVVEPGRVYVHFGSYGTAALDTKTGAVLWTRSDLPCRHYRGPGSSLLVFENLLLLTMDGVDVQYLAALDKSTGGTIWKTDRTAEWDDLDADGKPKDEGDLRKAYSTPLIVTVGGDTEPGSQTQSTGFGDPPQSPKLAIGNPTQMLSVGAKALYGYDPRSGRELWKIRTPAFSGAASPVYGQGIAYMITGFGRTELLAVRLDGRGDVTDTNVVWKTGSLVPQTPSPLLVDDLLFMINDVGVLTCLETASGKQLWRERLRGNFAASLLYADGHVYCFSREGVATVFKAARNYEVLATNVLDSGFMASPAVSGRTLFLRTKEALYRIESSP